MISRDKGADTGCQRDQDPTSASTPQRFKGIARRIGKIVLLGVLSAPGV